MFVAITTFAASLGHENQPTDLLSDGKDETDKPGINTKNPTPALEPSTITRVLKCFRFSDNMGTIFNHTPSKGLSSIAGIRFVNLQ